MGEKASNPLDDWSTKLWNSGVGGKTIIIVTGVVFGSFLLRAGESSSENDARVRCKIAVEKLAKWGADSDWGNTAIVTKRDEYTLLVDGRDVKFKNGFGAERYIVYTGIYDTKAETCTIVNIQ